MGDFYLRISLFLVLFGAVLGLVFWLMRRKERKGNRAQAEALAALAARLGGAVAAPPAAPWSADLSPPFRTNTQGLVNRVLTVSRPRFETTLDFRRGPWAVRVSEASMKRSVSNGTRTFYEHRIEVATGQLAPMKISRRWAADFLGRPLGPDHLLAQGGEPVREAPMTVAQRQEEWLQARLPAPADTEFAVFTSDLRSAARMLSPQAVEWLAEQAGTLPFLLTFEAGLLYATMTNRIEPGDLLTVVDAMLGLLDRIPGAAPVQARA